MAQLYPTLCLFLASCMVVSASENGGYYECDATALADDNVCYFVLTADAPDTWVTPAQPHDINRTVGEAFYRGVKSYSGDWLSVSPKPWVNGDALAASDDKITGDDWSGYALIFELIAPLRDMIMYDAGALTNEIDGYDTWLIWTRALTECNSKTEDYVARSGGTPWSTDQLYEFLKNPQSAGNNPHHYFLQYLEESAMDLVCLSTDLVMEHCDTIRAAAEAEEGVDRCNCWFDAYYAIYGECPVIDVEFTVCAGTVASVDCADVVPEEEEEVPEEEVGTGTGTGSPGGTPPDKPDLPAGPPSRR